MPGTEKTNWPSQPPREPEHDSGRTGKLGRGMVMFFSGLAGLTLGAVVGLGGIMASFAFLFLLLSWGGELDLPRGAPGALAVLGGALAIPGALIGAAVGLVLGLVSAAQRGHGAGVEVAGGPGKGHDPIPALWNPNAACLWSAVFTPIFGAWIQAKNWRALGRKDKAKASMLWVVASVAAVTLGGSTPGWPVGLGLAYTILWYFLSGRGQTGFVKQALGGRYQRKNWAVPLALAFLASTLFYSLVTALAILNYGGFDAKGGGKMEISADNGVDWLPPEMTEDDRDNLKEYIEAEGEGERERVRANWTWEKVLENGRLRKVQFAGAPEGVLRDAGRIFSRALGADLVEWTRMQDDHEAIILAPSKDSAWREERLLFDWRRGVTPDDYADKMMDGTKKKGGIAEKYTLEDGGVGVLSWRGGGEGTSTVSRLVSKDGGALRVTWAAGRDNAEGADGGRRSAWLEILFGKEFSGENGSDFGQGDRREGQQGEGEAGAQIFGREMEILEFLRNFAASAIAADGGNWVETNDAEIPGTLTQGGVPEIEANEKIAFIITPGRSPDRLLHDLREAVENEFPGAEVSTFPGNGAGALQYSRQDRLGYFKYVSLKAGVGIDSWLGLIHYSIDAKEAGATERLDKWRATLGKGDGRTSKD